MSNFLYVMGKVLSGELSCIWTDLVVSLATRRSKTYDGEGENFAQTLSGLAN